MAMNYNSYFPQMYAQTPYVYSGGATGVATPTAPISNQGSNNYINWVQGETGAKSINVPAGQTVLLMDSETNVFYVKSSDTSGFPLPLRTFKYEEVLESADSTDRAPSTYVTKEELAEQLQQLETRLTSKEEKTNGKFDI